MPAELERVASSTDDANACPGPTGEGAQSLDVTCLVFASTFVPFDSSF